jgi:selenocysteine lyase/cysteine desulfurase
MMIDVARARRQTPGCDYVLHFNNAGAALMPEVVVNRVIEHLRLEAEMGGYEAAAEMTNEIDGIYASVGDLIGADPSEVALTDNATRAWDMAFYSLGLEEGDRILTSESSYASNFIAFLQRARKTGAVVEVVPSEPSGEVSVDALDSMLDDRVALVALTHVPTNGGLVNPAADVGRVCREHAVPFLLDACQSVGQIPVDVTDIGCDFLSGTSRKYLRGPRGVGFLYVDTAAATALDPAMLDLRAAVWTSPEDYRMQPDAKRFETWESDIAARLGFGAAVDYALSWGIDTIWHFVRNLADLLRERLDELPAIKVRDIGRERSGIVTFTHERRSASEIVAALRDQAMNVSATTPSSTLLDARARDLPDMVRASVHYYNTEKEVARFAAAVAAMR